MFKLLVASFLALVFAVPAFAKPKDVYPVSCDDLWSAVKDTLGDTRDYAILSTNDLNKNASFLVIGNLTSYTDRVALTPKDGGCAMKATFLEVGPDNGDWRQFSHRLGRSLAKLQAAKPKPAITDTGQL